MEDYYTYIITNERRTTLYVGVTNDIARRMYEHKHGINKGFSKRYNLHTLVYMEHHDSAKAAIAREKYLKGKTREKKEALIDQYNPEWKDLSPEEAF